MRQAGIFGLIILMAASMVLYPASTLAVAQIQQNIEIESLAGKYSVRGRNPNGSAYSGSLTIRIVDEVANFEWKIGNQVFRGQGSLIGNVLVVNWSDSSPVLYTIDLDGNLSGTWKRGQASERLVRK